jgi:hypothetical protein
LEFPDSVRGMRKYAQHLETVEERDPARHDELTRLYCTGWAVASAEYRRRIKKLYAGVSEKAGWQGGAVRALREAQWESALAALWRKARKEIAASAKSAEWKVRIAREMRRRTTATDPWLAEVINMGHPSRVCHLINGI